jgi:CHAT domain-containing protein/predicted negative regulator of RcsB-dependent stress response
MLETNRVYFHGFALTASLALLVACVTPSIRVTREQNQGDILFNKHDYRGAITHYNLMLDASRKLGIYRNPSMESGVHGKIANCHEMLGDYESALGHVRVASEIDSINGNLINRISDYCHEGKIYMYMGSCNDGIRSLERALSLSERMDQSLKSINRLSIADNYLALAQLYSVIGRSGKAIDYSRKALSLFSQEKDGRGEMESNLAMANIHSDLGDLYEARRLTEKSLSRAVDLNLGTSRHYQHLASICSEAGEYENALRYQEKALKEAAEYGIMGQVIWTTIGMGDIYSKIGDLNKAEKFYREARRVRDTLEMKTKSLDASLNMRLGEVMSANEYFTSQGSFTGEAISSFRLAEMLMLKEKYDSALVYLNQSGYKFRASGNRQGLLNAMVFKGRVLVDINDLAGARPLLDTASSATDYPETAWKANFHLGRLHEKLDDHAKAVECYRGAIAVIEKIRGNMTIDEFKSAYLESKREVYDRLIRLLIRMDKPTEAFQVSELARARAFYDILANKKIDYRGSAEGDLIQLEQAKRLEIQKLCKLLQKGEAASSTDGARTSGIRQLREALAASQSEYEDIIQRIKLHNPAYAEMVTVQPVNISDLRSALDERTAAIAYWVSDSELTCWLITRSGITCKTVPTGGEALSSLIEKTRRSIESLSQGETGRNLSRLYSLLIGPLAGHLAPFANLVIIPNGSLHFLPFQALVDERGGYMVQRFNLVYAPSASVFMVCKNRKVKQGSRFMGMALSDMVLQDKPGLPGTEQEVRNILPLFPESTSAFGRQSTEAFVKKNAPSYNFIHFATHGSYNYKQPLYSHLLFMPGEEDDGRLNVFEVFELNINASLVTLSACETGLGNISQGDELVGLSRAFLFAGSSSVIVSLWAVADYPTSLLMTNFYKYLKDHDLQESLTLAQRDVIKIYPQPIYWSPFILIGNGLVSLNLPRAND